MPVVVAELSRLVLFYLDERIKAPFDKLNIFKLKYFHIYVLRYFERCSPISLFKLSCLTGLYKNIYAFIIFYFTLTFILRKIVVYLPFIENIFGIPTIMLYEREQPTLL